MTNAYDTRDLDDDPRAQPLRRGDSIDSMPEAAAIRSRLAAVVFGPRSRRRRTSPPSTATSATPLKPASPSWRLRSE